MGRADAAIIGRPVLTTPRRELSRKTLDRAAQIVAAALREAGHDPDPYWCAADGGWCHRNPAPLDLLWRAQVIAMDALGLPYEMRPAEYTSTESVR